MDVSVKTLTRSEYIKKREKKAAEQLRHATVSEDSHLWTCTYSDQGFKCGRCGEVLGFRPNVGTSCRTCGARIEEAIWPGKDAK